MPSGSRVAIFPRRLLISLRGTQSLRNSGGEVPDALNPASREARQGKVVWPCLDDGKPTRLYDSERDPVPLGFS